MKRNAGVQRIVGRSAAVALVVGLSGCSFLYPVHDQSEIKDGERVNVTLKRAKTHNEGLAIAFPAKELSDGKTRHGFVADALSGIPMAFNFIGGMFDAEEARHSAWYKSAVVDAAWYSYASGKETSAANPAEPPRMAVQTVKVTRDVEMDDKTVNALDLEFQVEVSSDRTAFRLVPTKGRILYAKAKLSTWRWYMPWTIPLNDHDDDVDLEVSFELDSTWVTNDLASRAEPLGKQVVTIRNLPLDDPDADKPTYHKLQGTPSGWFPLVPRSTIAKIPGEGDEEPTSIFGNGNFRLKVRVSETDDITRIEG